MVARTVKARLILPQEINGLISYEVPQETNGFLCYKVDATSASPLDSTSDL